MDQGSNTTLVLREELLSVDRQKDALDLGIEVHLGEQSLGRKAHGLSKQRFSAKQDASVLERWCREVVTVAVKLSFVVTVVASVAAQLLLPFHNQQHQLLLLPHEQ